MRQSVVLAGRGRDLWRLAWILLMAPCMALAQTPATAGANPTSTSAPATRPGSAPSVDAYIAEIAEAQADAAGAAYGKACAVDPNSIALHGAYLRRMIDLNQVQTAEGPAGRLIALGAKDALAYEVEGYQRAKAGNYEAAFTALLKTLEINAASRAPQANLGQIVAWAQIVKNKIADSPDLAAMKSTLDSLPEYTSNYKALKDRYEAQEKADSDKIASAQRDVDQAQADGAKVQGQIDTINGTHTVNRLTQMQLGRLNQHLADDEAKVVAAKQTIADAHKSDVPLTKMFNFQAPGALSNLSPVIPEQTPAPKPTGKHSRKAQ